ncbi:AraC family transcriptional regulator [Myxococcus stipitatus]|uniref:AraC family transcriptional regulator n=1 Tax=Myxococcus stipitatus TaxID=83455 RepID=UPI001F333BFE|nr:AraC family transcriptional regulator [Myxococcus stipitatus]MCE9669990.1 AraC family transcriptional regulator [Myxococcus stipitatus]
MEPLSAVLRGVHLEGSIYAAWELRAPWGMDLPEGPFASFHLVERGRCVLRTSREVLSLEAGELVVLFDGQPHRLMSSRDAPVVPLAQLVARHPLVEGVHRAGGVGEPSRLVCGKFAAEGAQGIRMLRGLPRVVHLGRTKLASLPALRALLESLAHEATSSAPGAATATARITEALFVQVLRALLLDTEETVPGWLAGLREPRLAEALHQLHMDPARHWSVGDLAARVGMSRTRFALLFQERVGQPPMTYLMNLRLDLVAQRLRDGDDSIGEIAHAAGFASQSGLTRAFHRRFGQTPSAFRKAAGASVKVSGR